MNWAQRNAPWLAKAREHWAPRGDADRVLIRAWLSQPMQWDMYDPITIEGGLQSVVCSLETGRMPDDVFEGVPMDEPLEATDIQIPICDVQLATGEGCASLPVACVSCGWFSSDAVQTVRWARKRPRAEHYRAKVVNTAMDWSKAANSPRACVTANYVEFYALGNAELLRRLLPELPNLSSGRSAGMGRVQGWEVIVDRGNDEQWPAWQRKDGTLMRVLPTGIFGNSKRFDTRPATLRAPYWHKRTMRLCDVPIQEVASVVGSA